jgi:hypothetical protein
MEHRIVVMCILAAAVLAACMESNPQPSPGKGQDESKTILADVAAPPEYADAMNGGEQAAAECVADAGVVDDAATDAGDAAGEVEPGDDATADGLPEAGLPETQCELSPADGAADLPPIPSLEECLETYAGCGCELGCMDGFWSALFYPSAAGQFPSDINPPQELLEVAVAKYECSVCTCEESWHIRIDGEWAAVDLQGFCQHIVAQDTACGGCLTTWQGGCC